MKNISNIKIEVLLRATSHGFGAVFKLNKRLNKVDY